MNFKDLQPIIGKIEKRLRYELERVTSVCEFDPKLNTNEIDYYNNTILHLESVIEKAIFFLKTNEIKNTIEFEVIKIRLKNLNQKLFELRAEAEDNNVKLNIELFEFDKELILEFLPENPTYLDNYKEIEDEVREFIRVDPEPIESGKPKVKFFDYFKVSLLFATGQLPIPITEPDPVPRKFNFDDQVFSNPTQLGEYLSKKLGVSKPQNYLRDTYRQLGKDKDLFTPKRAKYLKQYLEKKQISIIPEFQVFLEKKINTE